MIERFARQEAGVALPLAIIMIVLVAVMGAGLLVFVRNDLEAVVEVNQGQRAMDATDAGIQAGSDKRALLRERELRVVAPAGCTSVSPGSALTVGSSTGSPCYSVSRYIERRLRK